MFHVVLGKMFSISVFSFLLHVSPRDTKRGGVRSVGLSSTEECRAGEVGTVNALRAQGRQQLVLPRLGRSRVCGRKGESRMLRKGPNLLLRKSEF